jgi:hypothetical protein
MPLYIVIPSFDGGADGHVTTAALQAPGTHKVRYRGYWVEVGGGKALCLVETPSAAAHEAGHCDGGRSP